MVEIMVKQPYMPHCGYGEEDYVTALEVVRVIMEEGMAMGAKDFSICSDLNTELKFEGGSEDCEVSTVLTGMVFLCVNAVEVVQTPSPKRKLTSVAFIEGL